MNKKIAWLVNLLNIGVLGFLVANGYNPMWGATACSVAVLAILIVVIPDALKEGIVYNDEI